MGCMHGCCSRDTVSGRWPTVIIRTPHIHLLFLDLLKLFGLLLSLRLEFSLFGEDCFPEDLHLSLVLRDEILDAQSSLFLGCIQLPSQVSQLDVQLSTL